MAKRVKRRPTKWDDTPSPEELEVNEDEIRIPRQPSQEQPELPDGLSDLPDQELIDLLVGFTRWVDFYDVRLVAAEKRERSLEHNLDFAQARALVQNWGGASSDRVNIAKAEATMDPEVRELRDSFIQAQEYRKTLASVYRSCERDASVVSRELTRRTSFEPQRRRADRYS